MRSVTLLLPALLFHAVVASAAPGDLDPTFGSGGIIGVGDSYPIARDLLVAPGSPQGAFLLVHPSGADVAVTKFLPDGSVDSSFGSGGNAVVANLGLSLDYAQTSVVDGSGGILVCGTRIVSNQYNMVLAHLTSGGALDTAFGSAGEVSRLGTNPLIALQAKKLLCKKRF
jgi:hypothetical protein